MFDYYLISDRYLLEDPVLGPYEYQAFITYSTTYDKATDSVSITYKSDDHYDYYYSDFADTVLHFEKTNLIVPIAPPVFDSATNLASIVVDGRRYIGYPDPGGKFGEFDSFSASLMWEGWSVYYVEGEHLPLASGVPEPSTWAMMLIGFIGLGHVARRRRLGCARAA